MAVRFVKPAAFLVVFALLGTKVPLAKSLRPSLPTAEYQRQRLGGPPSILSRPRHFRPRDAPNTIRSSVFEHSLRAGQQQPEPTPWRVLFAEAFGTFWIVQLGTGAVMSAVFTNSLTSLWEIAVVWIIAVTSAIIVTGPISGAHLNPAITLVLAMFRNFSWRRVVPYWLSQLAGAVAGSGVSYALYASLIRDFEASQGLVRATAVASAKVFGEYFGAPVSVAQAFAAEAFGTAILAAVIFAVTHPRNKETNAVPPPMVIGGTVGALICVLAPLTQAGFNPARDFGPRIVAYAAGWTQVAFRSCWLYIVAPMLGAIFGAAFIDKVLYATGSDKNPTAVNGDVNKS